LTSLRHPHPAYRSFMQTQQKGNSVLEWLGKKCK